MLSFTNLHILQKHVTTLQKTLNTKSFFLVGGCIRDLLLDITQDPKDIDVTMSGNPNEIRDNLKIDETQFSRFRTEKFGTMTLIDKKSPLIKEGLEEICYEITPFREESGYADNRHPDQIVWSNNLIADSQRRDFTINALYRTRIELSSTQSTSSVHTDNKKLKDDKQLLDILKTHGGCLLIDSKTIILQSHELIQQANSLCSSDTSLSPLIEKLPHYSYSHDTPPTLSSSDTHYTLLIDPQTGLQDLLHHKLRAVGDPVARFTEDALRILRGIRFVNILNQKIPHADKQNSGFDIEKKTWQAMESCAPLVASLSAERLHAEITKVFSGNNPFGYIALLRELQLLTTLFPALANTIDNRQPVRYHPFDTYNHTLMTLRHCQHLTDDALVKLAMLYHDVGKPEQYAFMDAAIAANPDNPDRTGYLAHPEISVRLAQEDFGRLAFSHKEIAQICRYIKHHHRPGEILDSKADSWTKKVRELISDGGYEATIHLFTIAIADRLGQYNPLQKAAISEIEQLKTLATELYESEGRFTMKELAINGKDLIADFGLTPGPQFAELLGKAFERVMVNVPSRNNKKEIYGYLKTFVR